MKQVFFDTNIVIDVIIRKGPESSIDLLKRAEKKALEGQISSVSLVTINYLILREFGFKKAREATRLLLQILQITAVTERTAHLAYESDMKDFEDAVQYFSAIEADCDCIVTRNVKGFSSSTKPIYTPEELLEILDQNQQ